MAMAMEKFETKMQKIDLKLRAIPLSSMDDTEFRDRVRPQDVKFELQRKEQRFRRLRNTCRELQNENEQLKTELGKANETIRYLTEKIDQHEFQMQQMTKVINKMRRKNEASNDLVMQSELKRNLKREEDEEDDLYLHLDDIEGQEPTVNDMKKQMTREQTVDSVDIKGRQEKINVLRDMIQRLPAEGLKDLEKVLKSSEKDLSNYLSQIQRSKARNALFQNVKDDLISRTDRLLEMKRNLLDTVYTVCNTTGNMYQDYTKNSAPSRLSPVIEERGLGDDEYFQKSLVVPKLDLNPNENSETDRRGINSPWSQSQLFHDPSKQNEFRYLENNDDHVVFRGYHPSAKMGTNDREMKNKKSFTKSIRNIVAVIVNTFTNTKSRKAKASTIKIQTGNDVVATMSDISVLSRGDDVIKKSESLVPKLDFSNLESQRRDTSSIPLIVSLSDSGGSCQVSAESGKRAAKMSKSTGRPNGQKKQTIFSRFRAFVKGKK